MSRRWTAGLVLASCVWMVRPVSAGTITLDTQVDATPRKGLLQVGIRVFSHGDEAACQLQFKIEAPEGGDVSAIFPRVEVGEKRTVTLKAPIKGVLPGRYPLLIRTFYTDANQYPFSALAVSSYRIGEEATPGVLALLGHAAMEKSGRIRLRLKNLDGIPKKLTVRLFLPQELSSPQTTLEIPLTAGQETETSFALRNFSALDNSRYAVFAVIEYVQEGRHYTALAPGLIEIRQGVFLEQWHKAFVPAFATLLILFIGVNLYVGWKRLAPPRKNP